MSQSDKSERLWEVRIEQALVWHDVVSAPTAADAGTVLGNRIRAGEIHDFAGDQGINITRFDGTYKLGPAPDQDT